MFKIMASVNMKNQKLFNKPMIKPIPKIRCIIIC